MGTFYVRLTSRLNRHSLSTVAPNPLMALLRLLFLFDSAQTWRLSQSSLICQGLSLSGVPQLGVLTWHALGLRVVGFRLQGLGSRVSGLGSWVSGLGSRVSGLGFRV